MYFLYQCGYIENVLIVFRWVDADLISHEDFLGLYAVDKTDAATLKAFIEDVLCRLGLRLADCRGQCYDGAAVMSGVKSGLSTRILQVSERFGYMPFYWLKRHQIV